MLSLVPESVAMKVADLFATPGTLCARLAVENDGNKRTDWTSNCNLFECWVLAEEIALACRLIRMTGWKDQREEMDKLGLEGESKVCVTYHSHRQDFGWMRHSISYQDAEIAMMIVAEDCKRQLFAPK